MVALPPGVVALCRGMQERVRWVVLCPSALPRGTRAHTPGIPPLPLGAVRRGEVLDFGYNAVAGPEGQVPVSLNRPEYFLHFVVGRATEGLPRGARRARLGGHFGLLTRATPDGAFVPGRYFSNHVRFLWRENGLRYVATLHTFGERATERLLGRLVATLKPARTLTSPAPGRISGATRIPAALGATGLALTRDAVWVGSTGGTTGPSDRARLVRVDRKTRRQTRIGGIGSVSLAVAATPTEVWAASGRISRRGSSLSVEAVRISPATGAVSSRVPLGRGVVGGLAIADDAVWVTTDPISTQRRTGALWRIDRRTSRVTARFALPAGGGAVAVGRGSVWVASVNRPTLVRVDPRTGQRTSSVLLRPRRNRSGIAGTAIAVGAGAVWVTTPSTGTLTRIDPWRARVTARSYVGRAPYGLAIDRRGVWVAILGEGIVRRVDPTTNRVAEAITTGGDPVAVATDGTRLWVTLNSDGLLLAIPAL